MTEHPVLLSLHKPIIGMVHFLPLPGASAYDGAGGMPKIRDAALSDIEVLRKGGVDCAMFGNEGGRPDRTKASGAGLAAMAALVGELKAALSVPFGMNTCGTRWRRCSLPWRPAPVSRARVSPASLPPT